MAIDTYVDPHGRKWLSRMNFGLRIINAITYICYAICLFWILR